MYTYPYPRPSVTSDLIVFAPRESQLYTLLIRRKNPPYQDSWAIPGGFLNEDETTDRCAVRELEEETGVRVSDPRLIGVFSDPARDPRGRVISAAYYALTRIDGHAPRANDDAAEVKWFPIDQPPSLAFDHKQMLSSAIDKLREHAFYNPIGISILPEYFDFSELQAIYEAIFGKRIVARTLKRKLRKYNFVVKGTESAHSPKNVSRFFRFDPTAYEYYCKNPFFLDLNEKE